MNPYESLANAIILQAVTDYRKALKAVSLNNRNKAAKETINECEAFFRSTWYGVLTNVDGELLIKKLKAEVST